MARPGVDRRPSRDRAHDHAPGGAGRVHLRSSRQESRAQRSRALERAAAGERRTAEILCGLPSRRWAVLHDLALPGSNANVDHLAFGPTGAWLVDTKTTRGTVRVGWRSVRVGERRIDPAPTCWEAEVVGDRLGVDVRAVIVVHSTAPGARFPHRGRRIGRGVRVVAPEGLTGRLRRGRRRLSTVQIEELYERARTELGPRVSFAHHGGRGG